jgi:hypothetical protein
VARDATARQYDVEADGVKLDQKTGEITFSAKKGRLVDLDKLHESIWATRLSGSTGMSVNWLDVTVVGTVVVEKERVVLKVKGSEDIFVLKGDQPRARKDEKTAYARLLAAVEKGAQPASVFGRVEGWEGHFPPFLKAPPKKPRTILVKDFEPMKK